MKDFIKFVAILFLGLTVLNYIIENDIPYFKGILLFGICFCIGLFIYKVFEYYQDKNN